MAKRKPAGPVEPMFYATPAYKQWMRKEMAAQGWTFGAFAAEVKRRGAKWSSGGIGVFLGSVDKPAPGSNTELMPTINKILKAAPPAHCNPDSSLAQIKDLFDATWTRMTVEQRARLEVAIRGMLELADK